MSGLLWVGLVLVIALAAYLFYALLNAEEF
jgi:K+-transporting ATPase KdpF subunit